MKRLIIGLVVVIALVMGGVVVYVQFIRDDAPPPLAFPTDEASPDTTAPGSDDDRADARAAGDDERDPAVGDRNGDADDGRDRPGADGVTDLGAVAGQWRAGDGSEVGYRVVEDFIGGLQNAEAVGRTTEVTGSASLEVDGRQVTVTSAEFAADMASVESDDPRRDNQFRGRIMSVDEFPEARFELRGPVELTDPPLDGSEVTVTAPGILELRGVRQDVSVGLQARVSGGRLEILGQVPVVFADYDIPDPSNPLVSTRDNGTMEFLLLLTRAD
jgi:polyisoprenoid-binding protein YceI